MNKSNVDQNKVHFGFKIIIIMKSEREVNIKKQAVKQQGLSAEVMSLRSFCHYSGGGDTRP